ncbi:MAG: 4-hydroxy-tetrahydrodipicolinate reductase [Candidatus Woesearchaeota archaeon]
MVKIAIVGYGKMGKLIEKVAISKGHEIVSIIDPIQEKTAKEISVSTLNGADVCIDFTHPSVIIDNIRKYCELKVNAVIGTTGWYDRKDEIEAMVSDAGIGLIWSGNFSIGVNAYFKVVEFAAKLFNNVPDYDVMGNEFHHKNKADSPSGTASMVTDILVNNIDRKEKVVTDRFDRPPLKNELHFASVRGGSIPGIHQVLFDSEADTIELKHTARNREGFAYGSVLAAEFIFDKKGFFGINDLMDTIIKKDNN